MDEWKTFHLKVVLVGNSGGGVPPVTLPWRFSGTGGLAGGTLFQLSGNRVGKTSLMTRFVDHRFTSMYRATIGVDFLTKEMTVDKTTVTLQLWDTAGSERFHSLGSALYRGAHCCLLVFDLSSTASFSALDGWHKEFLLQANPADFSAFPFIVVGNKTDLSTREVSPQLVQQLCEGFGATYFECSAKEDVDVETAFKSAARAALHYFKCNAVDKTKNIQLTDKEPEKQKITSHQNAHLRNCCRF